MAPSTIGGVYSAPVRLSTTVRLSALTTASCGQGPGLRLPQRVPSLIRHQRSPGPTRAAAVDTTSGRVPCPAQTERRRGRRPAPPTPLVAPDTSALECSLPVPAKRASRDADAERPADDGVQHRRGVPVRDRDRHVPVAVLEQDHVARPCIYERAGGDGVVPLAGELE